jgi:RimJ/RimL family protein N-acetyltransferase
MIIGVNILLRGLELDDVNELMKHWNDLEVRELLFSPLPNSREEEIEWIRSTWERRKKGEDFVFAIVIKELNLYIGNISVGITNKTSKRGSLGIVIFNKSHWNKGYGTEAMNLMLDYSFNVLNLHSVELEVYETNERAYACYKKVGFKETGRKREASYYSGKYIDHLIMDILKTEWKKK